jgi:hypothetical protein
MIPPLIRNSGNFPNFALKRNAGNYQERVFRGVSVLFDVNYPKNARCIPLRSPLGNQNSRLCANLWVCGKRNSSCPRSHQAKRTTYPQILVRLFRWESLTENPF